MTKWNEIRMNSNNNNNNNDNNDEINNNNNSIQCLDNVLNHNRFECRIPDSENDDPRFADHETIHSPLGPTIRTIDDAIDSGVGYGMFQYQILLGTGLAYMSDAMEMMLVPYFLPVSSSSSLAVFVGSFVGSLFLGPVADTIGRRPVLLASTGLFLFTFNVLTAYYGLAHPINRNNSDNNKSGDGSSNDTSFSLTEYTHSDLFLPFCRFMVGIGIGALPIANDIWIEFLPSHQRGTNQLWIGYFWNIGIVAIPTFAYLLDKKNSVDEQNNNNNNNNNNKNFDHIDNDDQIHLLQSLVWISSIPCLLSFLVAYLCIPESPRWILSRLQQHHSPQVQQHLQRQNHENECVDVRPTIDQPNIGPLQQYVDDERNQQVHYHSQYDSSACLFSCCRYSSLTCPVSNHTLFFPLDNMEYDDDSTYGADSRTHDKNICYERNRKLLLSILRYAATKNGRTNVIESFPSNLHFITTEDMTNVAMSTQQPQICNRRSINEDNKVLHDTGVGRMHADNQLNPYNNIITSNHPFMEKCCGSKNKLHEVYSTSSAIVNTSNTSTITTTILSMDNPNKVDCAVIERRPIVEWSSNIDTDNVTEENTASGVSNNSSLCMQTRACFNFGNENSKHCQHRSYYILLIIWALYPILYYGIILLTTNVIFNHHSDNSSNINNQGGSAAISSEQKEQQQRTSSSFDHAATIVSALAEVIGTTVLIFTIDSIGRVRSQAISYILGGIAVFLLCKTSTSFTTLSAKDIILTDSNDTIISNAETLSPHDSVLIPDSTTNDTTIMFTFILLVTYAFIARMMYKIGICTTWVLTMEALPTRYRSTGHTIANSIARLSGAMSTYYFTKQNMTTRNSSNPFDSNTDVNTNSINNFGYLLFMVSLVISILTVTQIQETKNEQLQ